MIFLHLIHLLLSLTAATPISRYESPSSPLHKRAVDCYQDTGHSISPGDCSAALAQMSQHLLFSGPVRGPFEPLNGPFSRSPTDIRFLVPVFFRTPTCTIAVDTIDRTAQLRTYWSMLVVRARFIIDQCVARGAIGGQTRTADGFIIVVVNEQNLDPRFYEVWQSCLRQGLRVDITECLGRLGALGGHIVQYSTGG